MPQIVFDECHKAKNAGSTKMGKAVLDLQNKLPLARVVYASATGGAVRIPCDPLTATSVWLSPGRGIPDACSASICTLLLLGRWGISAPVPRPCWLSPGPWFQPCGALIRRSLLSWPLTRPLGPPGLGS